ncbi:MAG: bacillithiol biosynthesis deacetylase BshB1, partial [Flavobacteriales bacterium]|nr:bacillithiol biosynthesis deacetylase BshB1 [Flavobacteriales bacterium]
IRENMNFKDGFFLNNESHRLDIIKKIRKYKPNIVITNAPSDRHPDHGRASDLTIDSCFLSGLEKIDTNQEIWRPKHIYHYIQFNNLLPDFVVDITEEMDKKIESILCYKSQFYNPESNESETIISSKDFLESVKYRAKDLGRQSHCKYAEGFITNQNLKVNSLIDLI